MLHPKRGRWLRVLSLAGTVLATPTMPVLAQAARPAVRSSIVGTVRDSIAGSVLVGALVQLVSADTGSSFGSSVQSDSAGRFAFDTVPSGRYTLGFYHPMLDSLGLEPLTRELTVSSAPTVTADLAIPSATRLRAAICGPPSAQNAGAVLIGSVHGARGLAPVANANVVAEWLELTFGPNGVNPRTPRRISRTRETGWFAICGVPSPGTITVMASLNADSTDVTQLEVPAAALVRRELYLGPARVQVLATPTSATAGDSGIALLPRRVRTGDARLSGTVRTTIGGQPLGGAQVGILNGPQTRSNERGEWTLLDAPSGTRLLEVRAVGYYPERRAVDLIDSAPPVQVALATFKSVLDTMRVIASSRSNSNLLGFEQRKRSGAGRFLSPSDIAARQPIVTSELFRSVAGVFLDTTNDIDARILMRGVFEDRCEPAIYLNGSVLQGVSAVDLDSFIRPKDIAGIEVYAAGQVPAEFQPGLSGCGSIVFWTK